jgi:hypothetical protein
MIDDPEKAARLMKALEASLPMEARLSRPLIRTLTKQSPGETIPARCNVAKVLYAGEEGGILCALDFGGSDAKEVNVVSITHLIFERKVSVFREIDAYQRHRIKKLKQEALRGDGRLG